LVFDLIFYYEISGFLSTKLGVPIETVAEKGQGLAFVVYPTGKPI
jgi:hypothetical protein